MNVSVINLNREPFPLVSTIVYLTASICIYVGLISELQTRQCSNKGQGQCQGHLRKHPQVQGQTTPFLLSYVLQTKYSHFVITTNY